MSSRRGARSRRDTRSRATRPAASAGNASPLTDGATVSLLASADAAKEIKTLITANVARVVLGTQQVDAAGATMQQVVLEMLTNIRAVDQRLDPVCLELLRIADAAEHHQLRCVDAAGAHDDFGARTDF